MHVYHELNCCVGVVLNPYVQNILDIPSPLLSLHMFADTVRVVLFV